MLSTGNKSDDSALIKSAIEHALSDMGFNVDLTSSFPIINASHHEVLDAVTEYVEGEMIEGCKKRRVSLVETSPFHFTAEFY